MLILKRKRVSDKKIKSEKKNKKEVLYVLYSTFNKLDIISTIWEGFLYVSTNIWEIYNFFIFIDCFL